MINIDVPINLVNRQTYLINNDNGVAMSTFGERLKEARKEMNLSQGSLAKLVGVKQPTISELESDGKGSIYTPMLAKILGVNPVWLAEGKGNKKELANILDWHEPVNDCEVSVTIPLLDILLNSEQATHDALNSLKITRAWVAKKLPNIKNLDDLRFAHAEGSEMSGTFEDGDILLIDTSVKSVASSGIYALKSDNDVIYRRVIKKLNGTYEVSCDNQVLKNTEILDDVKQIEVIGRIAWVWNGKAP